MKRTLLPLLSILLLIAGCGEDHPRAPTDVEPVPTEPPADDVQPPDAADRFTTLYDDDEHHLFAVSRPFGDELVVIVTNWSEEAHGLRIPKPAPGNYELAQATTDEPYRVQTDEMGIILEIGARTVLVLRRMQTPEP